jgi:hypothetical protein
VESPGCVVYSEEWSTREDLKVRLRSSDFSRVLLAMELGLSEPRFSIEEVIETSGVDMVAALRSSRDNATPQQA